MSPLALARSARLAPVLARRIGSALARSACGVLGLRLALARSASLALSLRLSRSRWRQRGLGGLLRPLHSAWFARSSDRSPARRRAHCERGSAARGCPPWSGRRGRAARDGATGETRFRDIERLGCRRRCSVTHRETRPGVAPCEAHVRAGAEHRFRAGAERPCRAGAVAERPSSACWRGVPVSRCRGASVPRCRRAPGSSPCWRGASVPRCRGARGSPSLWRGASVPRWRGAPVSRARAVVGASVPRWRGAPVSPRAVVQPPCHRRAVAERLRSLGLRLALGGALALPSP